jgi:tight adherence protein C
MTAGLALLPDPRLIPPTLLVLALAIAIGEIADARERRRRERLRLRLGHLVTDTRPGQPLTMEAVRSDLQVVTVRIGRLAGRFLPQRVAASYTALLLRAGRGEPAMLPLLLTAKLLASAGGAALAILLLGTAVTRAVPPLIAGGLGGLLIGYLLPDVWLQRQITTYTRGLRDAVPSGIDLLTVSLEGGLGFEAAVAQLCASVHDPFAREMRVYQRLRGLGRGRRAALEQVARRTEVAEMVTFTTSVAQGEELGIGIVRMLRDLAADMRIRHRQRVSAQVQTASLRMMIPIVLFIMPSIFIVLLGPAINGILSSLR